MSDRVPPRSLVFLWDNFGPYHDDRINAIYRKYAGIKSVIGVELRSNSTTYSWRSSATILFEKKTVFSDSEPRSIFSQVARILSVMPSPRSTCFFLCHYEDPIIFLLSLLLRSRGGRVITMIDSKFDDKQRFILKEVFKSIFLRPYNAAFCGSLRTISYMKFFGFRSAHLAKGYDTVSLDRIRNQAGVLPAPKGPSFQERHFTAISRLIPKKNLFMMLTAYSLYANSVAIPRHLHICGSGVDEDQLRSHAAALGIANFVIFRGWLQDSEISNTLGTSVALLLTSVEEQFGIAVIEAQAMGLPVILAENCGARDMLVRNGINGFVVEPDNPRGLAYFMIKISEDEQLWRSMCSESLHSAPLGDVDQFVVGVESLLESLY